MEDALELNYYLPLSFKSQKEQEYIAFHWDAFDTSYNHYQFAFLACHIHTMKNRGNQ